MSNAKKYLRYFLILALVVLVVMQFIQPEKNQAGYAAVADFETQTNISTEVAGILKTNCYDCHSNHTNYPWYANIAPVSYWLDDHVRHGKGDFNVSKWNEYSTKKKDHKLEELIEEVEEGHMPLDSYTWIHGTLSKDDQKTLMEWASMVRLTYQAELQVAD